MTNVCKVRYKGQTECLNHWYNLFKCCLVIINTSEIDVNNFIVEGRLVNSDTSASDATNVAAAAAGADGSSSSLSLYSPLYSRISHQTPAGRLQQQQQQQLGDHIPRSHERQTHPYWAVESIRQALSMPPGSS